MVVFIGVYLWVFDIFECFVLVMVDVGSNWEVVWLFGVVDVVWGCMGVVCFGIY